MFLVNIKHRIPKDAPIITARIMEIPEKVLTFFSSPLPKFLETRAIAPADTSEESTNTTVEEELERDAAAA